MNRLDDDLFVDGNLSAKQVTLPAGTVTNSAVVGSAGISASKLQQQINKNYSQDGTTDATVERKIVHVAYGATGTLVAFAVGAVTKAAAAGNAVIDLLKNGSSILTAQITLDSTTNNYILKNAAGFSSTSFVAGDVFEIQVVSAAATKPKGLFFQFVATEDPA